MNLEGMDVGQVEGLARRMDTHTRTLESIAAILGGLAAELSHLWRGPAAATFQHDCETLHRPAIAAAASAISDMHQHLVANLAQQVRASAADLGGGEGIDSIVGGLAAGAAAGIAAAWKFASTAESYAKLVEWPFSKIGEIAGHEATIADHGVMAWLEREEGKDLFPYYKDSKIVRWLHDTPEVAGVDRFLSDTHAYGLLDKAPVIALGFAAVSVGIDTKEAINDYDQHRDGAMAGDIVNGFADGAGAIPVVGPFASFDIEMAKMDVQEIATGGPIPSPFSWQNLKEDYAPLPGEMWQQLLQDKGKLFDVALGGHG
jgi:uncharacterized protein YukE